MTKHDFKVGDWVTLEPSRFGAGLYGVPAKVLDIEVDDAIRILWDITHPKWTDWITDKNPHEENPAYHRASIFVLTPRQDEEREREQAQAVVAASTSYYNDLLSAKEEINGQ